MLKPNTVYTINGVKVNERIIPNGTVWQDASKAKSAGFRKGELYKSQAKLPKQLYITIHNTADLDYVQDDAEQYTRATYNENMGSTRVHFYVDDLGAWQTLRAGTGLSKNDPAGTQEVGWHSGDGTHPKGGNMNSLAIECIMGESTAADKKARANTVKLVAWLMMKHNVPINRVVSHTYWVARSAGRTNANVDRQCTTKVPYKKWCPVYIFGSQNPDTAYKNWIAFKGEIQKEYERLVEPPENKPVTKPYRVSIKTRVNIRSGPGTNYRAVGRISTLGVYTIVDESTGQGATRWGLLKAYEKTRNGWVSLDYCKKV